MLVSEPPSPNPRIIAWAREQSGYDTAHIAKRLNVKTEQVRAWEAGKPPTVRQLMNLATLLRRPLHIFFQQEPPRARPIAAEYRRLSTVEPGHESPEFRRAVRDMLARREIFSDLMDELGYEITKLGLAASLTENPRAVGARLRHRIGISDEEQLGWRDKWQAWREWRAAIENAGVLVFMFSDVPLEQARGIAIIRRTLPVAAVNTKEIAESRAFTALHEVIHLMLANGQEESPAIREGRSIQQLKSVEHFAEVGASYALASDAAFEAAAESSADSDASAITRLAQTFKMSPLAAATRLRESGRITWQRYNAWRVWNREAERKSTSRGFATPASKTIGRGGRMFAQLVFEALDSNRITIADAARALNLRTEHFDKLRDRLTAGSALETPDE